MSSHGAGERVVPRFLLVGRGGAGGDHHQRDQERELHTVSVRVCLGELVEVFAVDGRSVGLYKRAWKRAINAHLKRRN